MRPSFALPSLFLVACAAIAAPMIAPGPDDLRGKWTAASMTFEGAPRLDEKLVGSTWTFAGGELVIERRTGERMRFEARVDASTTPRGLALTPIGAPQERGGWMIYGRAGPSLRVAFFDDLGPKPSGFEPQSKLIVIALLPEGALGERSARKGAPCDILRASGVDTLIGPNAEVDTKRMPDRDTQCRLVQPDASVAMEIVPASSPAALAAQRQLEERNAKVRASRTVVQDEPQLGAAFSVRMGRDVIIWAFRGDTLMAMELRVAQSEQDRLLAFAQRVLARI